MAINLLSIGNNDGKDPLGGRIGDSNGGFLSLRFGAVSVPDMGIELTFGTGSGQANWAYMRKGVSLNATTFSNLDLAGTLTDGVGNTITATKLKLAVVALDSPDGSKALRVGPQNQSNVAQLGWGGTGATVYQTVTHHWWLYEPVAGYTITAGTGDVFPLYNPGGSAVTFSILLAGV